MSTSPENLMIRDTFLTDDLKALLANSTDIKKDYFTATEDYPKAFRVGECVSDSDIRASLQVLLLWRDETKSEQKEVHAEAVKVADKWLINKVSN